MWRRILLLILFILLFLVWQAPASLFDSLINHYTNGQMRLLNARGSVWHGQGQFVSISGNGRRSQTWLNTNWRINLGGLLKGRISWEFFEQKSVVINAFVKYNGIGFDQLNVSFPLRYFANSIQHPIAGLGWRGNVRLNSSSLACDWRKICYGALEMQWHDAGIDIFPNQKFGDYHLAMRMTGKDTELNINTKSGEVIIEGSGKLANNETLQFKGTVKGDPKLVGRLPAVISGYAQHTETPGLIELNI